MAGVTTLCFLLAVALPVMAAYVDDDDLVIPKSYSNLRIPGTKRANQRQGGGVGVLLTGTRPRNPSSFDKESVAPPPRQLPEQDSGQDLNSTAPPLLPAERDGVENEQVEDGVENEQVEDDGVENEQVQDGDIVYEDESPVVEETKPEKIVVDIAIQIQSITDIDEEDQFTGRKDYDVLPKQRSYVPEEPENISALLDKFGGKPFKLKTFDELWKPDIFIERVVKIQRPEILSSAVSVRYIKQTSSVIYTSRASVKTECGMDFQYYPADTQHCTIDIRSYQNDETKMNLRWNPSPGAYLVDTESDDNFDLMLSYVKHKRKKVKDISYNDAVFDVLQIQLSMRRRLTYHILQTYVPSTFLVFITWLSFLIPEELIEARIGISMTTLLTLTAMFSAVRENTPVVSYVKAIDIWMAYCIFVVFGTLLEFAFFVWLRNYKIEKRQKKLENLVCEVPMQGSGKSGGRNSFSEPIGRARQSISEFSTKAAETFERTAKLINQFAFGFFVVNFIIFNTIYWTWLFVLSQHSQWVVNPTLNGQPEGTDDDGFLPEL